MRKLLFAAAMLLSAPASAAEIGSFVNKENKAVITLEGEIVPGDFDKIAQIIKYHNGKNRYVIAIRLNSYGGNLMEGIKIAAGVRGAKIATVVANGSHCASACFVVFAGGPERYASGHSSIGVHGASDKDGKETVDSAAATVSMARVLSELGAPASIIGKMVITEPKDMVWLKLEDMQAMGVTVTGLNKGE